MYNREGCALYGAGAGIIWYINFMHNNSIPIIAIIDGNAVKGTKQYIDGIEVLDFDSYLKAHNNRDFVISAPKYSSEITDKIMKQCPTAKVFCFDPTLILLQKVTAKEIYSYTISHMDQYIELANRLSDDVSKLTLKQVLLGAVTSNCKCYIDTVCKPQYFPDFIIDKLGNKETFVDVGAYVGDSSLEFINIVKNKYRKIIVFEPDKSNFEQARINLCDERIKLIPKGVWHSSTTLYFNSINDSLDEGAHFIEESNEKTVMIEVVCLDEVINEEVTYIKLDVEGSELDVLRGAIRVLKKNKPKLAISVYHKMEDILSLSTFVLSLDLGYNLFLRHHWNCSGTDVVLYAI